MLISDKAHVLQSAARGGLGTLEAAAPSTAQDVEGGIDALPRDANFALDLALAARYLGRDDTVMTLDYRGPGLSADVRQKALRSWYEGDLPLLVSVDAPLNHPVQCLARAEMIPHECAVLAFFDAATQFSERDKNQRVTRCFPRCLIENISPEGQMAGSSPDGYVVRDQEARRVVPLFPNDWPENWLPMTTAVAGRAVGQVLCARGPDGALHLLREENQVSVSLPVLAFACYPDGSVGQLDIINSARQPEVKIGGAVFRSHGRLPEVGDAWGMLVLRMAFVSPNDATVVSRLVLGGGGWHLDVDGRCVNDATGMVITGRQDFPDLMEADGAMAICKVRDMSKAADLLTSGRSLGFVCHSAVPGLRGLTRLGRLGVASLAMQEADKSNDFPQTVSPEIASYSSRVLHDELLSYDVLGSLANSAQEVGGGASLLADARMLLSGKITAKRRYLAAELAAGHGAVLKIENAWRLSGILDPGEPDFWKVVRHAYLSGKMEAVIALLNATLSRREAGAMLYLQRAVMYGWTGQPRKALNDINLAKRYSKQKPLLYLPLWEGAMSFLLGQYRQAEICYLSLLKEMPDNLLVHMYLGVSRYAEGRNKEAVAQLNTLATGSGGLEGITRHLDLFSICMSHAIATVWMLERHAWGANPVCSDMDRYAVIFPNACLAAAGGWPFPSPPEESTLRFLAGAPDPLLARAIQARNRGEMGDALALCRQAGEKADAPWSVRLHLGLILHSMGRFDEASEYILSKEMQDNPWFQYLAMVLLFKQGRYTELFSPSLILGDIHARFAGEVLRAAAAWETEGAVRGWSILKDAMTLYVDSRQVRGDSEDSP